MKTKPPGSSRRRPKPGSKKRPARSSEQSILSRADRALIARLEKKGLLVSGPDAGKPLSADDELLTPGPACPGAGEAVIENR